MARSNNTAEEKCAHPAPWNWEGPVIDEVTSQLCTHYWCRLCGRTMRKTFE